MVASMAFDKAVEMAFVMAESLVTTSVIGMVLYSESWRVCHWVCYLVDNSVDHLASKMVVAMAAKMVAMYV